MPCAASIGSRPSCSASPVIARLGGVAVELDLAAEAGRGSRPSMTFASVTVGRSRRRGRSRRARVRAPAEAGPTRSERNISGTQAIEPPPAPMLRTSNARRPQRQIADMGLRATIVTAPSRQTATSAEVPPMSSVRMSPIPERPADAKAPDNPTGWAGEDGGDRSLGGCARGHHAAVRADDARDAAPAVLLEAPLKIAHVLGKCRQHVRVRDGRYGAIVLTVLREDVGRQRSGNLRRNLSNDLGSPPSRAPGSHSCA